MQYIHHAHAYQTDYDKNNFWNSTVTIPTEAWPALASDKQVEVAIVGAGFTGLNAALQLAEVHQTEVCVLDSSGAGWGASGRNGGFVCCGGSAHEYSTLVKRFGLDEAKSFFKAQCAAVDTVDDNIHEYGIDAERHSQGEWLLAAKPSHIKHLKTYQEQLKSDFNFVTTWHPGDALSELGMSSPAIHGALRNPVGFAINPGKYVQGLSNAALKKGITIHGNSKVTKIDTHDNGSGFTLYSNGYTVHAKKLIIATNGYTPDDWVSSLSNRILPVASNILVTEPLTDELLKSQGWTSDQMVYTSHTLLNYFRLMPNGRMLFGMRGNIEQSPEAFEETKTMIRKRFNEVFPAWQDVETPWCWSGLLAMSYSLNPYVGPIENWPNAYTAMAYHGNGVAMASHSGRLVADLLVGAKQESDIPAIMRSPLKSLPLGKNRLQLLRLGMLTASIKDRFSKPGHSHKTIQTAHFMTFIEKLMHA